MSNQTEIHPVEQRKKTRVALPEPPIVYDAHSGTPMGQIVNISVEGMMLAGPAHIAPGTVCQFRIQIQHDGSCIELQTGVESLWCQDVNNSGTYWTGFHIIDIAPQHQEILDRLIDE